MILVIKGADFSANNLGKIEIKREINPFTLAAIAASGNETMSVEQKSALDTFFESVGAFGSANEIWSKLDKVYIPFLCNNLDKAVVNYKTNIVDKELSSERYSLRNHGLSGVVENPTSYTEASLQENIAINVRDMTVLGMQMENGQDKISNTYLFAYEGNSGNNRWTAAFGKDTQNRNCVLISGVKPSGSANYSVEDSFPTPYKLLGITTRGADDFTHAIKIGLSHKSTINTFLSACSEDTPSKSLTLFAPANRGAMGLNSPSLGMMLLGKGMSDAELQTLKDAAEALVEFFK